ncbi:prepilin-type N-terminal cleavage/methylation domain-containing protein [Lysinibacillus sp. CNPSo 3705]|uniref:prepilin-type N-terminal cleavage/methylation domain-containing protein n=1 Tax=Lysinibacillus sp. CNPSo 3705 TaxID=3028148 RepID=UPI0023644785|nr:prepilin-type N-terminal cleavage/methylation domain-containing protein [Lysinibacillus sp. CNPSo 3705]MDD1502035.1 prepilin-type N-terminal cleavage/methylation domain-containing protein [Lysinibacillus sp. CNPSo 3705]
MFKKLLNKKLLKNQKGLTLIEVLAVVVILAIIAVIAIPAIGNIIDNSRIKGAKADAVNLINSAHLYYTDGGTEVFGEKMKDYYDTAGGAEKGWSVAKPGGKGDNASSALEFSGKVKRGNVTIEFSGANIKDIEPDSKEGNDKVKIDK